MKQIILNLKNRCFFKCLNNYEIAYFKFLKDKENKKKHWINYEINR